MRTLKIKKLNSLDYSGTEALNSICTNLSFAKRDVRKILVTSCTMGEGKSFVTMEIALNMARRGKNVALVDCDLRRSFMVRNFGIRAEDGGEILGLAHYLAGYCNAQDIIYQTNQEQMYLVPIGRDIANPIPLIDTPEFGQFLDYLANSVDLVLVDAPPVGMVIDAAEIAKHCDGTVFVVEYAKRHKGEFVDAINQMKQTGTPVLGCIVNRVTFNSLSEKKYYRNQYYSHYGTEYYSKKTEAAPSSEKAKNKKEPISND